MLADLTEWTVLYAQPYYYSLRRIAVQTESSLIKTHTVVKEYSTSTEILYFSYVLV